MGGQSTQTNNQSSTTAPWTAAQPLLQGILGQAQGQLGNTNLTGAETGAINQLEQNAQAGNPYSGQIGNYATNLLNGGDALNQSGNINSAYQTYLNQTNPLASNTNYDPMQTPGFSDAIKTMMGDITNQVSGSYAAAGRDPSGAGNWSQTLGRGISQGIAPTIAAQYNQNVSNQQGAAGNLLNAGNTNAGLLAGLQQQKLANQKQNVTTAGQALDANNYGANATLAAEAARRGIPMGALGLLAQIGIPLGASGSQSSGTSTTQNQMSGAQQFATILGGLGSLWRKA